MAEATFDLSSVRGMVIRGCEILDVPQWIDNEWRALANVGGCLAVVVLTISIVGDPPSTTGHQK